MCRTSSQRLHALARAAPQADTAARAAGTAGVRVTASWRTDYLPGPHCAQDARTATLGFCQTQNLARIADDAALVVSELIANACRFARGLVELHLRREGDTLVVEVSDDCPDPLPERAELPGIFSESGRGLVVVHGLADSWGWTPTTKGKLVWCRLR